MAAEQKDEERRPLVGYEVTQNVDHVVAATRELIRESIRENTHTEPDDNQLAIVTAIVLAIAKERAAGLAMQHGADGATLARMLLSVEGLEVRRVMAELRAMDQQRAASGN